MTKTSLLELRYYYRQETRSHLQIKNRVIFLAFCILYYDFSVSYRRLTQDEKYQLQLILFINKSLKFSREKLLRFCLHPKLIK